MTKRMLSLAAITVAVSALSTAQTSSPFKPPDEDLGLYVVNTGTFLDTGCIFRGAGPILVEIPVPATVNHDEIDANGNLINPNKLVTNGLLGARALIRFPVFDIDSGATLPDINPEVDIITFNGEQMGTLSGINDTWTDGSFSVPIEKILFQSENSPTVMNILKIDIDTANAEEQWCMSVDWVSIEYESAAPYVLVHGIAAQMDTWDESGSMGVLTTLDARGVLYFRVSLGANASVSTNANALRRKIRTFQEPLKSRKIHVIAHSKGGLDTQMLEALEVGTRPVENKINILTLSTLSTPHWGSAAGDLSFLQRVRADINTNIGKDPNGYATIYVLGSGLTGWLGEGPKMPGLRDLTVSQARRGIKRKWRGNIKNTFTFGAHADLNNDGSLTANETAVLFPPGFAGTKAAELAWKVLRTIATAPIARITETTTFLGDKITVLTYRTFLLRAPAPNDIVVTETSANPPWGKPQGNIGANHSTVKTAANITKILDLTIPIKK